MNGERVTLREIAQRANVHPSTVSRALNPESARRLDAETVERVRAIAAALGYEPNPWARSLRTRRSRTIGLVIPRLQDMVLAAMFESAEDRARELGYQAVTVSTRDRKEVQTSLVQRLLEQRVDGLVLATPTLDDPLLDDLHARDVPFVLMNRSSGEFPSVRGDDELGGYLATKHLITQGHRRIGIVAGPLQVSTAHLRCAGYLRAHREAGLPADPALRVETPDFAATSGATAVGQLLSTPDPPTAVFCVNDSMAIGAVSAARDLGLQIPDDLAVIGYNDTEIAPLLAVPLSSVALPLERMGRDAIDMLLDLLDGRAPASIIHAPLLHVRASSMHRAGAKA